MIIKEGLYWSDYHRQFYLFESRKLFLFWDTGARGDISGFRKSNLGIMEFFSFKPTYIGEF